MLMQLCACMYVYMQVYMRILPPSWIGHCGWVLFTPTFWRQGPLHSDKWFLQPRSMWVVKRTTGNLGGSFPFQTSSSRWNLRFFLDEIHGTMGWLKGKSTGKQRISHEIWEFPVISPLNQSIELHNYNFDFAALQGHFATETQLKVLRSICNRLLDGKRKTMVLTCGRVEMGLCIPLMYHH